MVSVRNIKILFVAFSIVAPLSLVAEDLVYKCADTYQNSPCVAGRKKGLLDKLPPVSRYEAPEYPIVVQEPRAQLRVEPEIKDQPKDENVITSVHMPMRQVKRILNQLRNETPTPTPPPVFNR